MRTNRIFLVVMVCIALMLVSTLVFAQQQAQQQRGAQQGQAAAQGDQPFRPTSPTFYPARMFNTVKQKLMNGQQVFCNTLTSPDTAAARKACQGVDFIWIEMQHSTLNWESAAQLVRVIASTSAIPFIRVPDASESMIQKATDAGALGIIVPMADTVEKAQDAVKYAKFPPIGRLSSGSNAAGGIWGPDYRQNANDNMMVVLFCETVESAMNIRQIASVTGVDVVFIGSSDLGRFSGLNSADPQYEALVTQIKNDITWAGRWVAGPSNWANRPGYVFFQGTRPTAQGRTTGNDSGLGESVAPRQAAPAGR